MNKSQLTSHAEQMEAARAEFAVIWESCIVHRLDDLNIKSRAAIMHLCWHTFLAAKGLAQ